MWLRSEDQWTEASHKSNCFVSNCQIIYYNFLYILFLWEKFEEFGLWSFFEGGEIKYDQW